MTMNLDDESLLSAYLDGELDPARRLAVEAALLSRPQLAARLQDLARVRL
ncbi:MAG: zf-HC2 domain-containing protein, partial [Isosphaeraceae bacterium]|nr:zf-HC2 domain-containing protein [Isosphaeraceae bacterium]